MSAKISTAGNGLGSGRTTAIESLKTLKTPEEGGTKKEYEDFLEKISTHASVSWEFGEDIAHVLEHTQKPAFPEPIDLTDDESKVKWQVRVWNQKVDRYAMRVETLDQNMAAMYSLLKEKVSKLMKSKIRSKTGYKKAEEGRDIVWLLETMEDIVLNFEETKPKLLAVDDQMERIMVMKQGDVNNEDFIKTMLKELKVYEKHGGDFLWGSTQKEEKTKRMQVRKAIFISDNGRDMDPAETAEASSQLVIALKEEIQAMTILKRADTKRYGALQKRLHNAYLLGTNEYPRNVGDILKVLNNYEVEYTTGHVPSKGSTPKADKSDAPIETLSFLQANSGHNVKYARGTNNSFFRQITCKTCGLKGHYQTHCPIVNSSGNPLGKGPNGKTEPKDDTSKKEKGSNDDSDTVATTETMSTITTATEASVQKVSSDASWYGHLLNQQDITYLNPHWVLLDSESTDHIFCNSDLLTDIQTTTDGEMLRLHTSAGSIDTNQKGKFGDFTVWYNPTCLANVLSLGLVTDRYRVTMDSDLANEFRVHISDQHVIPFKRITSRLYLFDTSQVDIHKLRFAFSFLTTVDENKRFFQARDIRKADEAAIVNRKVNHMAKDQFLRVVKNNWIRNLPVTMNDVQRSHIIYGPPIPPMKGRTRNQTASRLTAPPVICIPPEVHENLKEVTLCIDFHFVNNVTVFHTISQRINYRTVSFPNSRSANSIMNELKDVYKVYNSRGFKITDINADQEFRPIAIDALPVRVHICGTDEHVPEIERSVQTQKNQNRAVSYAMPFKCIPRLMVRELISQGNVMLNAFGTKASEDIGYSPRNLIDNLPHVDFHDLKYEFGQYVQLHETNPKTNTMQSRTIGAIVLGPRNITGKYNYMSLETGQQIDGRVVATLPTTNDVIARVEGLGRAQNQPFTVTKMLQYEWRPGVPIDNQHPANHGAPPPGVPPIVPHPVRQAGPPEGPNPVDFLLPDAHQAPAPPNQGAYHENDDNADLLVEDEEAIPFLPQGAGDPEEDLSINESDVISLPQGAGDHTDTPTGINDEDEASEIRPQQAEARYIAEALDLSTDLSYDTSSDDSSYDSSLEERRNIERERRGEYFQQPSKDTHGRGKRDRTKTGAYSLHQTGAYSFLQTKFENLTEKDRHEYFHHAWKEYQVGGKTNLLEQYATGFIFNQMSAKQGIKKYGRMAELKLIAEFKQLMEYKTFHGRDASKMTYQQKKKAANMINLIEEKLNRGHTPTNPVIKGRSVFNGRVQRGLYSKEDTASPTVSQDAFFLTSLIDAVEGRDKAVTDIKGAYLNAKMKDEVFMKIMGPEIDLFVEIDQDLAKYIAVEKGKRVLYVQLDKALYGCVQSALLWYELYSETLADMGFELNPYDLCVANAVIEGEQCTICWYVDDNKISHVNPAVVDKVISKIEEKFGKMSQTRGDKHDFLGMNLVFKKNKITVSMKKHILRAMETFPEDIVRDAATPAANHLFNVRETEPLSEEKADVFHSVTASLLFISRRCRLDIQTAVAFLCTRVSCPTMDDWKKLRRVLQYLRGTIDLVLTLGADNIRKVKSWVDVSYGTHDDCKSHTGGAMSWGWGVLLTKCQKQKLNTKSSTEGEIVGASDYLPNIIWARMFLEAQGFELEENILYQDNQSAMLIEKNGKRSSGQKTKHMDNRYFWIKDRLDSENIQVKYCPTEKMLADFFTKPLQGSLFRKFRDVILGYKHISELENESETIKSPACQERVGKSDSYKTVTGDEENSSLASGSARVTWADIVKGKSS